METFKENYGGRFVDVHMTSILDGVTSTNISSNKSRATYVHYVRVDMMMFEHISVLALLICSGIGRPAAKTLGIMRFHDPNLYISLEERDFSQVEGH